MWKCWNWTSLSKCPSANGLASIKKKSISLTNKKIVDFPLVFDVKHRRGQGYFFIMIKTSKGNFFYYSVVYFLWIFRIAVIMHTWIAGMNVSPRCHWQKIRCGWMLFVFQFSYLSSIFHPKHKNINFLWKQTCSTNINMENKEDMTFFHILLVPC